MMGKECYESVDTTFRDIMRHVDPENAELPFGGKVMVFGGDFRQVLPIVPKGSRAQSVNACLNKSHLWQHMQHMRLVKNMRVHRLQGTLIQSLKACILWKSPCFHCCLKDCITIMMFCTVTHCSDSCSHSSDSCSESCSDSCCSHCSDNHYSRSCATCLSEAT